MQFMNINFDTKKIQQYGVYTVEQVWAILDTMFDPMLFTVQLEDDGSVSYIGKDMQDSTVEFALPYRMLLESDIMRNYASEWHWYTNELDGGEGGEDNFVDINPYEDLLKMTNGGTDGYYGDSFYETEVLD